MHNIHIHEGNGDATGKTFVCVMVAIDESESRPYTCELPAELVEAARDIEAFAMKQMNADTSRNAKRLRAEIHDAAEERAAREAENARIVKERAAKADTDAKIARERALHD